MARDIFTVNLFGHTPSLTDLLVALDREVASGLLGVTVTSDEEITEAIENLDSGEAKRIYALADLIHSAAQVEPDEIDHLAKEAGLKPKKSDSPVEKLFAVLEKSGEDALNTLVNTSAVSAVGKFSDYSGKRVDPLNKVKLADFASQLEKTLEQQISNNAGDTRHVKVRPRLVPHKGTHRILCGVYYERTASHGREIKPNKQLVLSTFKRPAGSTYFWIRRGPGGGARMTIRNCEISAQIRGCVGPCLWSDGTGFASDPLVAYNLEPFKDPKFALTIAPSHAADLSDVSLVRVTVSTSNHNRIVVKTLTKKQDALEDFHSLAKGAPVLIQGSKIEDVEVRFRLAEDKRKTVKATLTPTSIQLEEAHMDLVQDHLEQWGITSD